MTSGPPICVRLIPAAQRALKDSMERTGYNRSDIINRAIQAYDMIGRLPVGGILTKTSEDINEIPYITHRAVWRGRRRSPGRL